MVPPNVQDMIMALCLLLSSLLILQSKYCILPIFQNK